MVYTKIDEAMRKKNKKIEEWENRNKERKRNSKKREGTRI
jgi:hypothetical protein